MPVTFARAVAAGYQKGANLYGPVPAMSKHGQVLIDSFVETFQVSRDAARVRLSVLGILGAAAAAGSLFG